MGIQQTDAYACLKDDWGEAYRFENWPGSRKPYRAFRRDDSTELSAETPEALRELIRADYMTRPVPREMTP